MFYFLKMNAGMKRFKNFITKNEEPLWGTDYCGD